MGPLVYLRVAEDPRLNPPIARDSEQFAEPYEGRSGSERVFSHYKGPGGLARRPWRRQHLFQIGALAHAIGMHARAWAAERLDAGRDIAPDALLAALAALAAAPLTAAQAARGPPAPPSSHRQSPPRAWGTDPLARKRRPRPPRSDEKSGPGPRVHSFRTPAPLRTPR